MIKIVLPIIITLFIGSFCSNAQLLETQHYLNLNFGMMAINGNSDNLFFPADLNQNGIALELNFGQKIKPWIAGGLSVAYSQIKKPGNVKGFAQVHSEGSTLFTAGPQIIFHSPYKITGLLNWLKIGLAITPQYHYYFDKRSSVIDNEVILVNDDISTHPVIEMNSNSSGFSVKMSPEMNYRITQRLGIRLAYNIQFLNVHTGFDKEQLLGHSFTGGLLFTFGNNKQLF